MKRDVMSLVYSSQLLRHEMYLETKSNGIATNTHCLGWGLLALLLPEETKRVQKFF